MDVRNAWPPLFEEGSHSKCNLLRVLCSTGLDWTTDCAGGRAQNPSRPRVTAFDPRQQITTTTHPPRLSVQNPSKILTSTSLSRYPHSRHVTHFSFDRYYLSSETLIHTHFFFVNFGNWHARTRRVTHVTQSRDGDTIFIINKFYASRFFFLYKKFPNL